MASSNSLDLERVVYNLAHKLETCNYTCSSDTENKFVLDSLQVISLCLEEHAPVDIETTTATVITTIYPNIRNPYDQDDDGFKQFHDRMAKLWAERFTPAIACLDLLAQLSAHAVAESSDGKVLLTLAAFTDESQPWVSTAMVAAEASVLLNRLLRDGLVPCTGTPCSHRHLCKEKFMRDIALGGYLRPAFSKSKPDAITVSGRRAAFADPFQGRGEGIPDDSAKTKPWKFEELGAIPVAAWVIREADDHFIAQDWPLLVPMLLTLVDDNSTSVRRQGLLMLKDFLQKVPSHALRDTGLAQVFEDAIFPTLGFLPSLTPEDESTQLLGPAFEALICLANKQVLPPRWSSEEHRPMRLYDRILREGVFSAYNHANRYMRIVEILCQQATTIINLMGIDAVKHLKDLMPMLESILGDSLGPLAPATLVAAVRALQAVLLNCWPRLGDSDWDVSVIVALSAGWLGVHDQVTTTSPLPPLACELLTVSIIFEMVLAASDRDLAEAAELAVQVDPALADLFGVPEPGNSTPSQAALWRLDRIGGEF